jgi:hypothetical protein
MIGNVTNTPFNDGQYMAAADVYSGFDNPIGNAARYELDKVPEGLPCNPSGLTEDGHLLGVKKYPPQRMHIFWRKAWNKMGKRP